MQSTVKLRASTIGCIALFAVSVSIAMGYGPSGWISAGAIADCARAKGACDAWTVMMEIRLPRLVNGGIVGSCLAAAGVMSQGFFRNDLASPSVTGAESAGLLGAAVAYFYSEQLSRVWSCPLGAMIGVISVSVFLVSIRSLMTSSSTTPILLIGIAISTLCAAVISLIVALLARDPFQSSSLMTWLMGSLSSRSWEHVRYSGPLAILGWLWALRLSRQVDYLSFGEDFSRSVGISIRKIEFQILLAIACLVGASVAIAGGIVFVGLVIPHITRQLFGPHHQPLLIWSSINGATLVILSDFVARTVSNQEISTGVVIALLGSPFFCMLLARRMRPQITLGRVV